MREKAEGKGDEAYRGGGGGGGGVQGQEGRLGKPEVTLVGNSEV